MEAAVMSAAQHAAASVESYAQRATTWMDVHIMPFWENKVYLLATTLFWFLHMRLSGSISYRLSTSYRKLSDEEKINWCVRTCAITHAIFALGTIPGWVSPPDSYEKDRMYATMTSTDRFVLFMTIGYFIWDICVCLWYSWGAFFTAHAFASFGVFYSGLYPSGTYYLGYFLGAFEISTPYFHLREILIAANKEGKWYFPLVSYIFAVTFTAFRIVGGFWVSYNWWCDTLSVLLSGRAHSPAVFVFCYAANITIMALQVIWFWKLIEAALGRSGDAVTTSSSDKKEE